MKQFGEAVSVILLLSALAPAATAGERVNVCFNYGCASDVEVLIEEAFIRRLGNEFKPVSDPVSERETIAGAVAKLYRYAGGQTPIFADRGGNLLDAGVEGRMDCIDHSTTTTRFLALIERNGWLRYHRVIDVGRRTRLVFQHLSAVIEEIDVGAHNENVKGGDPAVPDHVPLLLALCDCADVLDDLPAASVADASPAGVERARFAVDSWFVDHGEPAVILPLAEWLKGGGPNVY